MIKHPIFVDSRILTISDTIVGKIDKFITFLCFDKLIGHYADYKIQ